MHCNKCGTKVNEQDNFCPFCGDLVMTQPRIQEMNQYYIEKKVNTLAVVGFGISFLSWLLNPLGITAMVAIGLSISGLIQINNNQDSQTGKPFAIIGICIGAVSLVFIAFFLLWFMALFFI